MTNLAEAKRAGDGPAGIGGWLAVMIVGMTVLGPLMTIGRTSGNFEAAERGNPNLLLLADWSSFKTVTWTVVLVICTISVWGGYELATKRTPAAVSRAKMVLWTIFPFSVVLLGMIIPGIMLSDGGEVAMQNIPSLVVSLIAAGIWTAYLSRSKRVRNTYGIGSGEATVASLMPTPRTDLPDPSVDVPAKPMAPVEKAAPKPEVRNQVPLPMPENEDAIYASIAEELDTGKADKGLWTRLYADCNGDEKQTRVQYIKRRFEQLLAAERARIAEQEAEKKVREEAQRQEERERLATMPIRQRIAEGIASGQVSALQTTLHTTKFFFACRNKSDDDVIHAIDDNPLLLAVKTSDGAYPLHILVREKRVELIKRLVEKGVPVDILNADGETPLQVAFRLKDTQEIIAILEAAKA